ncbi:MAG: hypothetical protein NW241_09145 [Bacteroidia bacterium]|nr:hypothetical protein [Bacteroidia bacterium]
MKRIYWTGFAAMALLSACTGSRYTATAEYDDVYYSRSDRTEVEIVAEEQPREEAPSQYYSDYADANRYREPIDSYRDYYYEDDDFAFSRRLRRFHQPARTSWRYYDPFYANDLYFVMGTPYWNNWNSWGWYNWNRPTFGSAWGWNDPFFNTWGWGNTWNTWNTWNAFSYNPYVGAYYGWGPDFGFGGWNGFNTGGFYSPAFYGGYYCPPTGFVPYSRWNRYTNWTQSPAGSNAVTRVRNSTQGASVQNAYVPGPGQGGSPRTSLTAQNAAAPANYLTPRGRIEPARTLPAAAPRINSGRDLEPSVVSPRTPASPSRVTPAAPRVPTAQPSVRPGLNESPTVRPSQPSVRPGLNESPTVRPSQPSVRPGLNESPTVRPSQPSVRPSAPSPRPPAVERPSSFDRPSYSPSPSPRPSYSPSGGGSSSPRPSGGGGSSSPSPRRP